MASEFKTARPRDSTVWSREFFYIRNAFIYKAGEVFAHVAKGRKWVEQCKQLSTLLLAISLGVGGMLHLQYRKKVGDVQHNVRHGIPFVITLVRET